MLNSTAMYAPKLTADMSQHALESAHMWHDMAGIDMQEHFDGGMRGTFIIQDPNVQARFNGNSS